MKRILIIIILAIMFFGFNAQAASFSNVLTPESKLWKLKVFYEDTTQSLRGAFDSIFKTKTELNYIIQREANREKELSALINKGKTNSTAYNTVLDLNSKLETREISLELNKLSEDERSKILLERAKKEEAIRQPPSIISGDPLNTSYEQTIHKQMDDLRQNIISAQKAGDDQKVSELLNDLNKLHQDMDNTQSWMKARQEAVKQKTEKIADSFSIGYERVYLEQLANTNIANLKAAANDPSNKDYQDFFNKAIKGQQDLIDDLNKISLDQLDKDKMHQLYDQTQNDQEKIRNDYLKKKQDDESAKQLPEEKNTQAEAEKIPEQQTTIENPIEKLVEKKETPVAKPTPTPAPVKNVPVEKKTLKPLGEDDNSKLGGPITMNITQSLFGEVGKEPSSSFCWEGIVISNDLCTNPANISGGKRPYHFVLDSGTGFPPIGVKLAPNGMLVGAPEKEGKYKFGVCVVDLSGLNKCKTVTLTVKKNENGEVAPVLPAPAPTPEPISEPIPVPTPEPAPAPSVKSGVLHISIDTNTCQDTFDPGYPSQIFTKVQMSGTASGPVGTRLRIGNFTLAPGSCGSWTLKDALQVMNPGCERQEGQPEQTHWSGGETIDSYNSPEKKGEAGGWLSISMPGNDQDVNFWFIDCVTTGSK